MATNFPTSLDSVASASPLGFGEVKNQAYTLTTATHTNSVTTLTVASTSAFSSAGYLIVKREIISYTGKTATTFTGCTRATGGTTAAAFPSGAVVEQVPVAANHNDLAAAIVAVETVLGAGFGASNSVPRKLGEVSGTGSSGVLEFASIPSTYRALRLALSGRSDTAATSAAVRLTFETSPTAGAYYRQLLRGLAAATSAAESIGAVDYIQLSPVPGATSTANLYGMSLTTIHDYTSTSKSKTLFSDGGGAFNLAAGGIIIDQVCGVWNSTAAIDRIRLTLSAGNWTTASLATLYGLPA